MLMFFNQYSDIVNRIVTIAFKLLIQLYHKVLRVNAIRQGM